VTGEIRRVRYVRNRAVIEFTPKRRGQRLEALHALCYAWAVRQVPAVKAIDLRARAAPRPVDPADAATKPPTRPLPKAASYLRCRQQQLRGCSKHLTHLQLSGRT
jgi:hypothetical protein